MKLEMKSMSIYFKEILLSLSNMFWGSLTWKGLFWMGQSDSSVAQWCLTHCNCMDCSTLGFPVHHQLLEFTQTHGHRVGDAIQPSHPLSSPSPPAFSLSQHQGLFQWVSSLHQVARVLEFQLQHQSFQGIFRIDFLFYLGMIDWIIGHWWYNSVFIRPPLPGDSGE